MRTPLCKVYGHIYPAETALEEAMRAAVASAVCDNDDIPLLERDGNMLRISFEGSYFPEEDLIPVIEAHLSSAHCGKIDILDLDAWQMTRYQFQNGVLSRRTAPLNNVLDYSGHYNAGLYR